MTGYCMACGAPLGERLVEGKLRPACTACGTVVFADPKLAVAVLIEQDGQLLLGRRSSRAKAPGKWSFPAGFVDRGEPVEIAAIREVREETGLEITIDALLGAYSSAGEPVVLLAYAGTICGGTLAPADDLSEVAYFALDQLPDPAFAHDPQIVADWCRWRADQQTRKAKGD